MPPTVRIRPYKDFLTPALHRRFALATAVLAAVCYVEAIWIGEWNSFLWSWFPLGRAGIRTGLFFICGFMIFILRVAQLHVGIRTSNSRFHTFTQYALKFQTVQTALWYLFSAWFFSEVYIWSVPESAGLNRIKLAAKTSRPILNEKPIYLTMYLLFNAIVQAGFHLWYDYDRIDIPFTKTGPEVSSEQPSHTAVLPIIQLKAKAISLAISCLKRVTIMAVVSPPITYESRDPNGSLLTGLKGKKLQTRAFAFWELVEIAQRYQGRRKAVFEDIDRAGGSAWSQILAACLETVNGISQRIDEYELQKQPAVINVYEEQEISEPVSSLPRLLTAPLKNEPQGCLVKKPKPAESRSMRYLEAVGSFAKSQGQLSPPDKISRSRQLKEDQKKAVTKDALPTKFQRPEGIQSILREQVTLILRLPIGTPFRQEYRREIASVVLGTPHGDLGIIVNAIDSITRTQLGAHWTDVEGQQESPEVDLLLAVLKCGLKELVGAFGDYIVELKISQTEFRAAREAMNMAPPRLEDMEPRLR
ncbi:hypothetical protein DID88_002026 [Monilinia fructigena]|uniref:Nuclear envelope protein n=1 Tax=Monilinia fructigena TaxID=38457 RepID=A0A395IWC9_9HELO|nr:hypothetical protein DID88_002026 [Monilinia fructigena]